MADRAPPLSVHRLAQEILLRRLNNASMTGKGAQRFARVCAEMARELEIVFLKRPASEDDSREE